MPNQVKFKTGTKAEFNSKPKDPNTIYFIEDTHEIFKGSVPYTVGIVNEFNNPTDSIAPSALLVKTELDKKANNPVIQSINALPQSITLLNNSEVRYNGSGVNSVIVKFTDNVQVNTAFYACLKLNVSGASTVEELLTIDQSGTISSVQFLNGDLDLSESTVAELLFFYNGNAMCCIAYQYGMQ